MDQLEEWRVRGRVATAAKKVRDTMARLVTESQELDAAVAEAESLRLYEAPIGAGVVQ